MLRAAGTDGALTESSVETETASKYVVGEDMEVIDDLEEGSEGGGGSNNSGEEDFSEADEGSASSSGSSKSESGWCRVLFVLIYIQT